jgi:archaellum biogenesis protein FlaJ (TadC family)
MAYSREYLGKIYLTGGFLAVGQPGIQFLLRQEQEAIRDNYHVMNEAVLVSTEFKEGYYSVYGTIGDGGQITNVEVVLTPEEE